MFMSSKTPPSLTSSPTVSSIFSSPSPNQFFSTSSNTSSSGCFHLTVLGSSGGPIDGKTCAYMIKTDEYPLEQIISKKLDDQIICVDAGCGLSKINEIILQENRWVFDKPCETSPAAPSPSSQPSTSQSHRSQYKSSIGFKCMFRNFSKSINPNTSASADSIAKNDKYNNRHLSKDIQTMIEKSYSYLPPLRSYPDSLGFSQYSCCPITLFNLDCSVLKKSSYQLASELQSLIPHYLITHPHLDHISALVLNSPGFDCASGPRKVYGSKFTIDALKKHVFNGIVWPNLACSTNGGFLKFITLPNFQMEKDSRVVDSKHNYYYRNIHGSNGEDDVNGSEITIIEDSHGLLPEKPPQTTTTNNNNHHCHHHHDDNVDSYPGKFLVTPELHHATVPINHLSTTPVTQLNQNFSVLPFTTYHGIVSDGAHLQGCDTPYYSTSYLIKSHWLDQYILVFGDLESSGNNKAIWQSVAPLIAQGRLKTIVVECSMENVDANTPLFGHMTPQHLGNELGCLANYVTKSLELSGSSASQSPGASLTNHCGDCQYSKPSKSEIIKTSKSFCTTQKVSLDANSCESRKPLEGLKVLISHVKETNTGKDPRRRVLEQLLVVEKEMGLGCGFTIVMPGITYVV
ncbi:3',5'-cyclic-nucleotide phosphodiesterase [Saccharomycopsis crataegensis]|uniref:3',5'-cyclic-nucleotide phosphodiesterase n=1 Tax=Saccharomycopsis crataegensis TaxID=43959 RepID=A0AAV5QFL0_9ASCO|nr:3',5'-cyclic-nucleotide phosphodiesterase [Saccharomycopsis crataegensis]